MGGFSFCEKRFVQSVLCKAFGLMVMQSDCRSPAFNALLVVVKAKFVYSGD